MASNVLEGVGDEDPGNTDIVFKICLIGSGSVGKTALVTRFIDCAFLSQPDPTVGVHWRSKQVQWQNKVVTLQLWDTAGQDNYSNMAPIFCRKAHAVLVCYNTRDRKSFEDIDVWIEKAQVPSMAVLVLIGTKADLPQPCAISAEEVREKAAALREEEVRHFETSSRADHNVEEIFEYLVNLLMPSYISSQDDLQDSIRLDQPVPLPQERQNKCCKS